MNRRAILLLLLVPALGKCCYGQNAAPTPTSSVWTALTTPMMDPAKSAHTENVEIVRDRVHIILTDGTIQFVQPANGIVFGAVFHGKGRVQAEPPNPIEAQQLFLFTKQPKLDMPFTDATFSSTDGLLEEVAKQVKWQGTAPRQMSCTRSGSKNVKTWALSTSHACSKV